MSLTPTEIPSVKDELERKTVELLETLVHRSETHRMEKSELAMVAKALWNVTSGLVDNSVSDLCAAAAADTVKATQAMRRHFVGKGRVLSIVWAPNSGGGYVVSTLDAVSQKRTHRAVKTEIGLREAELDNLFATLVKSGYVQL